MTANKEFFEDVLRHFGLKPKTLQKYIHYLKSHLLPCADPEGRDRGSGPTLENHKFYGFLYKLAFMPTSEKSWTPLKP